MDKKRVPGRRRYEPHPDPILWVGTSVQVAHVELLRPEICEHLFPQCVEFFGVKGDIHRTPPDISFGRRLPNDKLVPWRTAGMRNRYRPQRPFDRQVSLHSPNRMFINFGRTEIPVRTRIIQSEVLQAERRLRFHKGLPNIDFHGPWLRSDIRQERGSLRSPATETHRLVIRESYGF